MSFLCVRYGVSMVLLLPLIEVFTVSLCPLHRVLLFHSTFHVIKGTKSVCVCVCVCENLCAQRHTPTRTHKWTETTLLSPNNSTHLLIPALPSQSVSVEIHTHSIQQSI